MINKNWKLIEELNFNKNGYKKFQKSIQKLDKKEQKILQKFYRSKQSILYELLKNVKGLGGDDTFKDLTEWIIANGELFYKDIIKNIKNLRKEKGYKIKTEIYMNNACYYFFNNSKKMLEGIFAYAFIDDEDEPIWTITISNLNDFKKLKKQLDI